MRASARGWWSCAEPADGGEAGYEEVLAAPQGVEAVNAVHPAWGRPRHREVCPLSCRGAALDGVVASSRKRWYPACLWHTEQVRSHTALWVSCLCGLVAIRTRGYG